MGTQEIVEAFRRLPADERVRLVEELWAGSWRGDDEEGRQDAASPGAQVGAEQWIAVSV